MVILVIDDEPLVRMSFERLGRKKGHTIYSAEEGGQGKMLWAQVNPDVVVLDLLLPGQSGPEILAEMKERNRAKVVLISAYSGEYSVESVQTLGAHLFIAKPFDDIYEVMERIEKLV